MANTRRSASRAIFLCAILAATALLSISCRPIVHGPGVVEITPAPPGRAGTPAAGTLQTRVTLRVNAPGGEPVKPFWIDVVGSCNGVLWAERAKDLSAHLAHIHQRLGTNEVRFHNILSLVPQPADAERRQYDFSRVDIVYDAIMAAGVRPLVEVSFMPPWLASGSKTIFAYKGNVTPPRNIDEWKTLVTAFAKRLEERYSADEVRKWRFEIWNEPDLSDFWSGSREDYYHLYKASVEALHAADPALVVGGPSSALTSIDEKGDLVRWFLERNRQDPAALNFVTWHLYGGFEQDGHYNLRGLIEMRARIDEISGLCRQRELPLLVTEWNSTPHPHDAIHDEPLNAAFALNLVRTARGKCDAFAYWVISDLFAEQGVPTSELSGGFGLLSLRGLEKPVFKAFEMLGMTLGGKWILPDEGQDTQALASWNKKEKKLVLLLWNWPYDVGGSTAEMPALARDVDISMHGLPRGRWQGTIYRLDATHANVTAAWRAMGEPAAPTHKQMETLTGTAKLAPERLASPLAVGWRTVLTWKAYLKPGDCCAVVLTRE